MSNQPPRAICKKCNNVMTPTGKVDRREHVGFRDKLTYREYICDVCGARISFLDWEH